MKYLQLIPARIIPENIKSCLEEQPARSGLYNWIFAFKGDYGTYWSHKEDLEKYDIVQINMSPVDMPLIPELRRLLRGSSTKLVLNNDYVCERWGDWGVDPFYFQNIQRQADMVFSTEPHQVSQMIEGTYTLPHPTNTVVLKHLGTDQKEDSIGFIYHWWAPQNKYLPYLAIEKVRKKYGIKKSTIFGDVESSSDMMNKWTNVMFNERVPLLDFPTFAQRLQAERCIYDPNPFHTYGRNGVELACFRRPVVGSTRVFSYTYLFKELACAPYDMSETMKKFDLVFKENSKVDSILDRAYEQVEFFNYKNSKERYMAAFEESIDRGGYEWYQNQK